MRIISIVLFVIIMVIFLIIKKREKKSELDMDENNFVIRQPKTSLLIGIMLCSISGFGIIAFALVGLDILFMYLMFSFLFLQGFFTIIYYLRWRLIIENNQITFFPFLKEKKTFSIDEITNVKSNGGKKLTVFNHNQKLFSVFSTCKGSSVLISRLKKEQNIKFD